MQRSYSTVAALCSVVFLCGIARSAENGLVVSLFDNKDFTNRRVVRVDSQVDYSWGNGSPAPEIGADEFSVRWESCIEVPASGTYVFHTYSDDGVRLWLDDTLIVNNWTNHSPTENSSAPMTLVAGQRYNIRAEMYEQGGGAVMSLRWTKSDGTKEVIPASQFFLPAWYTNPPVVTSTVPADAGGIDALNPSVAVVFSKPMDMASVEAAFNMNSLAGSFSWSCETLTFKPLPPLAPNASYTVSIGEDAQAFDGSPLAPFSFVVSTGTYNGFLAQYFDTMTLNDVKLSRIDQNVNFDWGSGSPSAQIGVDTYSARWTGYIQPLYSEEYTFSVYIDNGVRLWVNNTPIIDDWRDVSPRTVTGKITLAANQKYPVKLEFFENYGGAQAKFYWQSASQTKQIVPAQYLFVPDNAPLPSAPTNVTFSHIADRTLILTWQPPTDDSPIGRYEVYRDGAYVASTGLPEYRDTYLTPNTTYSYTIRSVSPVGGMSGFTAPVSATTLAPVAVGTGTGLLGKYYDTIDFHDRLVVRTDAKLDFNWGTGVPAAPIGADTFSIIWAGKIQPQYSEQYTIYTLSDDGVAVWINGQLVIDNWTDHGAKEDKGTITLQAGQQYDIRVHYYEQTGNTRLALIWESLSQPKEVVPTTQLYPAEFLAGAEIRLLTSECSPVSPAWTEGKTSEEANVTYTLNGQTLPAGRLDAETWYVDTASAQGLPFGVVLDPQNATLLNVTANDGAGNTKTVGYTLHWTPTKLNKRSWSEEVLLRKGDSLLFMVSGDPDAAPPTGPDPKVEIVVAGTSTETLMGDIGQKFPHQFTAPGTYLITGKLCGVEVGSLTVKVLAVDLHVPIAAVLNYLRELDVYVQPAGQANHVLFQAANQTELTVGTKTVSTSGATLTLKPRVLTDSPLIARLGGANGPMIGLENLEVFKMESLNNKLMAFTKDRDNFGTGVLRFKITPRTVIANDKPETPAVEGLYYDITLRGSGVFFTENGRTAIRVSSTREDENGIIAIGIQISPNGTLSCHDIKAVQINSEYTIGGGTLNNPPIVEAQGGLYLVRELSDEVERTGEQLGGGNPELNLEPANDQNGKQICQVWDRDVALSGRWTDHIKVDSYNPRDLERAFWPGARMLDGASPNRWFTVKVSGSKLFNNYVTKFELSKTFPPIGGAALGDNGANRDEIVEDAPGKLVWGSNGKPKAYPAINQTPNFYTWNFDAEHNTGDFTKEYESWDKEPWGVPSNPVFTDIGFYKGNMFGYMDVRIFADVCTRLYDVTLVSETRPAVAFGHNEYQSTELYGDHEESPSNAVFPDLISVGRLEADGYKGENDRSSRDRMPDVVGASVYRTSPDGGATVYTRTMHDGLVGKAMPVPVQITFRARPGETVKASVSLATRDRSGAKDGLRTHRAWVSLTDNDIYEYRGQAGESDEVKAQKVFKVTGFEPLPEGGFDYSKPLVDPAERVVVLDMIADGNGFGAQVVYVYGIEETVERFDELKLVVWGEECMGWKAKVVGDQDQHNQNQVLALEQAPHGETGNAIYRWCITDEEPINVVRIAVLTSSPAGPTETPVIGVSDPRPVVTLRPLSTEDFTLGSDNKFRVTVSGVVEDALADIIKNGSGDIAQVTVYVNGYPQATANLQRDAEYEAANKALFRPYPYRSLEFSADVDIPGTPGSHTIEVRTSENMQGATGFAKVGVGVTQIARSSLAGGGESTSEWTANVDIRSLPSELQDEVVLCFGGGDKLTEGIHLLEQEPFVSQIFRGSGTDPLASYEFVLLSITGLESGVEDSVTAILKLTTQGTTVTIQGTFVESDTDSGRFVFRQVLSGDPLSVDNTCFPIVASVWGEDGSGPGEFNNVVVQVHGYEPLLLGQPIRVGTAECVIEKYYGCLFACGSDPVNFVRAKQGAFRQNVAENTATIELTGVDPKTKKEFPTTLTLSPSTGLPGDHVVVTLSATNLKFEKGDTFAINTLKPTGDAVVKDGALERPFDVPIDAKAVGDLTVSMRGTNSDTISHAFIVLRPVVSGPKLYALSNLYPQNTSEPLSVTLLGPGVDASKRITSVEWSFEIPNDVGEDYSGDPHVAFANVDSKGLQTRATPDYYMHPRERTSRQQSVPLRASYNIVADVLIDGRHVRSAPYAVELAMPPKPGTTGNRVSGQPAIVLQEVQGGFRCTAVNQPGLVREQAIGYARGIEGSPWADKVRRHEEFHVGQFTGANQPSFVQYATVDGCLAELRRQLVGKESEERAWFFEAASKVCEAYSVREARRWAAEQYNTEPRRRAVEEPAYRASDSVEPQLLYQWNVLRFDYGAE